MRIGIDFDNTIAGYDTLFATLAAERGLFQNAPQDAPRSKRALRDALRKRPEGELTWRRRQAEAYGGRMTEAELLDGVDRFIRACGQSDLDVVIVSHKTRHANFASDGTDLRQAAVNWMEAHGFFAADGLNLNLDDVYFENTRAEKVDRIAELDCDWFIDDLEEVFIEPRFPSSVRAILYDPHGQEEGTEDFLRCRHWDEIGGHVLGPQH